ncbi:hypothetical protein [Streptomyces sp. NPDC004270]
MSTQAAPQAVATTPHTGPAPADTQAGHPRRWSIVAVLGAVALMAQLDFFVVGVALDGIGRSFPGTGAASVSRVLSAYAIVFASALVPAALGPGPHPQHPAGRASRRLSPIFCDARSKD